MPPAKGATFAGCALPWFAQRKSTRLLVRRGREAAVPAGIVAALERILGTPIRDVKVIEHSWYARLHGGAVATTRRQRIYLRDSAAEFFANPWLMLHEYCHVIRQWQPGKLTVPRYVAECLRHGYWNNHYEVEAREFADLHSPQLHALLQTQPSSASRR